MKYRKKPVVIEAVQLLPSTIEGEPPLWWVSRWVNELPTLKDQSDKDIPPPNMAEWEFAPDAIYIPTLEGCHRADIGDFIIRGIKGEFYPCKPDIFAATYEPIQEAKP